MALGRTATPLRVAGCLSLLLVMVGCQTNAPDMGTRLIAHAAMIDFSGLAPTTEIPGLAVNAGIPEDWDALPTQSNALFTHRQWRSPSHTVGVGVAHLSLPLPVSAKTVIWFARNHYGKQAEDAGVHFLQQWTDSLGREWFEAENDKYFVRGYAVTDGFDGWVVYTGYRRLGTPHPSEINLAVRSMESIVPTPMAGK